MNLENIKNILKKKIFLISAVAVVIWLSIALLSKSSTKKDQTVGQFKPKAAKGMGISVDGADQQAYMARLEKNYYDFEDRVKDMETRVKSVQSIAQSLKKSQQDIAQTVLKLDESLGLKMDQKLDELKKSMQVGHLEEAQDDESVGQDVELSIAEIEPIGSQDWVYLPIGSFCEGTLLTGVYAAADANNPLPVLISLDEAFYGPNKTRVPLKGAFVIGKAYGDLVSERALIQIVAISTVLPDSHAFENEQDLGYITDKFGELGIKGQVVYNTGRQLALSFMGGFVSGGSQALADSEVTTRQTLQGDTSKSVTGNAGKNALFSGLAQSAGNLSKFYEKQAEELVPAVHVKNGAKVYFIVQKGVTINGLDKNNFTHQRFMD